jgi:hypothetical protein
MHHIVFCSYLKPPHRRQLQSVLRLAIWLKTSRHRSKLPGDQPVVELHLHRTFQTHTLQSIRVAESFENAAAQKPLQPKATMRCCLIPTQGQAWEATQVVTLIFHLKHIKDPPLLTWVLLRSPLHLQQSAPDVNDLIPFCAIAVLKRSYFHPLSFCSTWISVFFISHLFSPTVHRRSAFASHLSPPPVLNFGLCFCDFKQPCFFPSKGALYSAGVHQNCVCAACKKKTLKSKVHGSDTQHSSVHFFWRIITPLLFSFSVVLWFSV